MEYLNLDLIKKHLNIDEDFHDDDDYLKILGDVAEQVTERHIDDSFGLIMLKNHGKFPPTLMQAMLLLVGNYYNNRESVAFTGVSELPQSYLYLLSLYQNYDGEEGLDRIYFYNELNKLFNQANKNTDEIADIRKHKISGGTWIDVDNGADSGYTHVVNVDDVDQGEY